MTRFCARGIDGSIMGPDFRLAVRRCIIAICSALESLGACSQGRSTNSNIVCRALFGDVVDVAVPLPGSSIVLLADRRHPWVLLLMLVSGLHHTVLVELDAKHGSVDSRICADTFYTMLHNKAL